jgi:WhiB family redox-sensing transcriptional regulator
MTSAFTGGDQHDTVGPCTQDPDRWLSATDEATKAICRGCPRRWRCARDAVEMPAAEGMWAGIAIPGSARGRSFALRQLRSLAERGGYPPRASSRCTSPAIIEDDVSAKVVQPQK